MSFGRPASLHTMVSRTNSTSELGRGLSHILLDAKLDQLPTDLASLEDGSGNGNGALFAKQRMAGPISAKSRVSHAPSRSLTSHWQTWRHWNYPWGAHSWMWFHLIVGRQ